MQLSHSYAIRCRAISVGIFTIRGDQQCEEIRYELWALDLYCTLNTKHYVLTMSFRGGEVCNEAVTGPGLDEGYFGQEFPTNRHHNQGRSDILLTAGVSFMFVGGGGGDAMELKYFIDLFYGGGSCDTVLWSCRADNRSMTRLRL